MRTIKSLLTLILFFCLLSSRAEIKMPSLFADNMVLQQQTNVALWGWANPGARVKVIASWNNKTVQTTADSTGKWKLFIPTPSAGGPYTLKISDGKTITLKNILIGEVWLCSGQSNMEMPMKGYQGQPITGSNMAILRSKNSNIRFITVPRNHAASPRDNFDATWQEAMPETVSNFSATAYYFGKLLNEILGVPVGLVHVSYGGSCIQAWMSKATAVDFENYKIPATDEEIVVKDRNRTPTVLFNGMLSPVIGYGMRGAIWYQGEANFEEPLLYEQLFQTMVDEWRTLWGIGQFPIYYCQIAPYNYAQYNPYETKPEYNSAYLRDAQRKCASLIPNAGMAVLMDCADFSCIHPADKDKAGERMALLALSRTYGRKGFTAASPEFKEIEIAGSTLILSFENVPNGLTSFGKEIKSFEIAGADKKYYPATAFLRGKSVIVSSPRVKEPIAVRYAWKDFVEAELFNTEGLPLSSFRTDNW